MHCRNETHNLLHAIFKMDTLLCSFKLLIFMIKSIITDAYGGLRNK